MAASQRLSSSRAEELGFIAKQRVHVIPRNGEMPMTNRYKKAVIEDVVSHGIDEAERSNLLDLFEYAMKSVATTLVREARFDMSDFATSKQRGLSVDAAASAH